MVIRRLVVVFAAAVTVVGGAGCTPGGGGGGGGGNTAPTAAASATPTSGTAPMVVSFSSAGSVDPDGTIVSYEWSFGDGSPVDTSANPTHTFTSIGTHGVLLEVTDDDGATATATVTITVASP